MKTLTSNPAMNFGVDSIIEKKPVRIAAVGLLLALLSACGSNVTPRSSTSLFSGSGPTPSTSLLGSSGEAEAQCSLFDSSAVRLGGRITTYYYNGVLQEDKVRVRLTTLPENFDTNTKLFVQAFRWKVNASGVSEIDSAPVQFRFERGAGSVDPISPVASSLSSASAAGVRTSANISGSGTLDLMSKTTMVISGVDYNWQALKFVVYDSSTTPATVVGQADLLLPVFQANPNRYALSHSQTLNTLHPFYSQRAQSLSETEWGNRTQSFCF